MATKKYVWKFDLEEYLMTRDIKEDFAGKVKPIQTFYLADVARKVAEEPAETDQVMLEFSGNVREMSKAGFGLVKDVTTTSASGNPFIQLKSKKERLMKTTLHYIIAILLFSLNATHAFAEEEKEPFNITKGANVTYSYNDEKTLLTIGGYDSIKITGDGMPVNCGIVIAYGSSPDLTIENLNIKAKAPFKVPLDQQGHASVLTLEGTNKQESTTGVAMDVYLAIKGSGSLTVQGGDGAPAVKGHLRGNPILIAIDGKDAEAIPGNDPFTSLGGLLIQGEKTDAGIVQTSSELKGNLTLGSNFEIPSWATVTCAGRGYRLQGTYPIGARED